MGMSPTSVSKFIASPKPNKEEMINMNLNLNQSHSESDVVQSQQEALPSPSLQASVSTVLASPEPNKEEMINRNLSVNQSYSESDAVQSQHEALPSPSLLQCSSPSERTESPGNRASGGRVYNSKNGKSCHQCRQKTLNFSSACKTLKNNKLCTLKFCHKCLLNRYGEKAEEMAVSDDWTCPKCRGICNCSFCMKKRGYRPTGMLVNTAKESGFSSVSEMLHVKGPEIFRLERTLKVEPVATPTRKMVTKSQNTGKNTRTTDNSNVDIQLPQGADLTTVAGIDVAAEDVGHALQFLEFCAAFGKVLDLKEGQSESILRELLCGDSIDTTQSSLNVRFHAQLLSLIQKDLGEESHLSSTTSSRDSWLKALRKCISESHFSLKDWSAECFARGDSYDKLDSSQKLRVLNFLCDETLDTVKLRNWIEEQNSRFVEREKQAKEKVLAAKDKEKCLKWKLQDEVTKAILLKNDTPLSISEHQDLVSNIKVEVAKAHAETLEAMGMVPNKKQRSDAVRTDPVLLDEDGCVYWNLRGYSSESNILLQDIGNHDSVRSQEKWYSFDVEQTEVVKRYISLRTKRLKTNAVPDILPLEGCKGNLKHESPDDSSAPFSPKHESPDDSSAPSSPTIVVAGSKDQENYSVLDSLPNPF
ncbi:hypothetical protein NE237_021709 [Protea cynaroides]|uniref:DDT domain-containing protein n=1 Tax=Protea cynaroides TaxID=273540 RepID=A0A9Q0H9L3_9MAGN|nr:hypothetical protein NE237_021709 [Protea cynaroides]